MSHATHAFPIQAVTKERGFLSATAEGEYLFSVRGGIPLTDAFEKLSLMLAQARAVAQAGGGVGDLVQELPFAAVCLLDFSHALLDSMHTGLIEHEKTIAGLVTGADPITP